MADVFSHTRLTIPHLERFWSRSLAARAGRSNPDEAAREWAADNALLSALNLGLEETITYLLQEAPSLAQFEAWILSRNGGAIDPARIDQLNSALSNPSMLAAAVSSGGPLTSADLDFWDQNGYIILHDAVPAKNCRAAVAAICEFLEMDPGQPDSWYKGSPRNGIWVPLLRHPAFEANRNAGRIHRAFEQIWGRTDLWMTVDQAGMNPPERPGWIFPGPHLHWDTSLELPIPFGVQGILYLTDTAADQGAFTCVPGFHHKIEEWIRSLPPGSDPRRQNLSGLGAIPIPSRAGDLIIWRDALPHGSSPNRAALPRYVQYMTMRPTHWMPQTTWR